MFHELPTGETTRCSEEAAEAWKDHANNLASDLIAFIASREKSLNPNEYQKFCVSIASKPEGLVRTANQSDALMGVLGAAVMFGGFADLLKKHLFYGKHIDAADLKTEIADASVAGLLGGWEDRYKYGEAIDGPMFPLTEQESRLLHTVLGLFSELEEISSILSNHFMGLGKLDPTSMAEEMGDSLWYLAEGLDALGYKMADAMSANMRKLSKRYPEGRFSKDRALNRDLKAERRELEGS